MRDESGRNIFALSGDEKTSGGRSNAAYDDLKYISQEAEWFLGGLLEGLPDGESLPIPGMRATSSRETVVPLMCPNVNSYKRLLGGEVGSLGSIALM